MTELTAFLGQLGMQNPRGNLQHNLSNAALVEKALRDGKGQLSQDGALVVRTGAFTGRAAEDKYVVADEEAQEKIWWGKDVKQMTTETFHKIRQRVLAHLQGAGELFVMDQSVGAHREHHLGVRLLTTHASHALFARHMFRPALAPFKFTSGSGSSSNSNSNSGSSGDFLILHAPDLLLSPQEVAQLGTRSGTVIATYFQEKTILILGTLYAGEIKKSVFSIMNYLLPDRQILPMHSGANVDEAGRSSVFFGLSGTGKTTLSTDEGKSLIGDDEHGLSREGLFNFEGGCYAKAYKLSLATEPDIFKACQKFGALLENVVMDPKTRQVDFNDKSLAENTRASYPLSFIEGSVPSAQGPVPQQMFFLSADAFGVLPPVARLNRQQAMYYFLSGYTAKLAGTEVGVVEPKAAFSTCFGAPFMLRKPYVYGALLGKLLDELDIRVWLINTGWTGGPYGVGERFPLSTTRAIIRAIQAQKVSEVAGTHFVTDEIFGFQIPQHIEGVSDGCLNPKNTWKNQKDYLEMAQKLAQRFHDNFKRFEGVEDLLSGGPIWKL